MIVHASQQSWHQLPALFHMNLTEQLKQAKLDSRLAVHLLTFFLFPFHPIYSLQVVRDCSRASGAVSLPRPRAERREYTAQEARTASDGKCGTGHQSHGRPRTAAGDPYRTWNNPQHEKCPSEEL